MVQRRIAAIDQDTGEVLEDGVIAWVPRKSKSVFGRNWYMAAQNAHLLLAKDRDIPGEAIRVFLLLTAFLDFENYIRVSQADIAKELGLQKQNVNRSVKILLQKGLILEGPRSGQIKTYRLNPNCGWKGDPKKHRKEISRIGNVIAISQIQNRT